MTNRQNRKGIRIINWNFDFPFNTQHVKIGGQFSA
ncbi:Uncharacterised protein [Vibrio cholerae]|nr:Uncharacterised protein [Vibrio cholerae]